MKLCGPQVWALGLLLDGPGCLVLLLSSVKCAHRMVCVCGGWVTRIKQGKAFSALGTAPELCPSPQRKSVCLSL